ncbi:hypothetical protein E4U21_005359 [Claviceps maximensis]|nr:hypothetical protein E4U21_005359 [Claviceps maximensis]
MFPAVFAERRSQYANISASGLQGLNGLKRDQHAGSDTHAATPPYVILDAVSGLPSLLCLPDQGLSPDYCDWIEDEDAHIVRNDRAAGG